MKGLKGLGNKKMLSDMGFLDGESSTIVVHDADIGTVY
jgi:Fe2+ transport system protein FeoA